eukprot:Amastigsp_a511272_10.p4 type:complete len:153 gc:universal Amastigsp_a511272_10:931-473(-)
MGLWWATGSANFSSTPTPSSRICSLRPSAASCFSGCSSSSHSAARSTSTRTSSSRTGLRCARSIATWCRLPVSSRASLASSATSSRSLRSRRRTILAAMCSSRRAHAKTAAPFAWIRCGGRWRFSITRGEPVNSAQVKPVRRGSRLLGPSGP